MASVATRWIPAACSLLVLQRDQEAIDEICKDNRARFRTFLIVLLYISYKSKYNCLSPSDIGTF